LRRSVAEKLDVRVLISARDSEIPAFWFSLVWHRRNLGVMAKVDLTAKK
jgi:hypothetical protein